MDWQNLDLLQAIDELWVTNGVREKFQATLELHPVESDLPDIVRFAVYRVAQEGISNVLHHSGATKVRLELGQRYDWIYLVLEDNGSSFDADEELEGATPSMRGVSLRAMRDNVMGLGGCFGVGSHPFGTNIDVEFPVHLEKFRELIAKSTMLALCGEPPSEASGEEGCAGVPSPLLPRLPHNLPLAVKLPLPEEDGSR
jgi:signal transduction histidine kinase